MKNFVLKFIPSPRTFVVYALPVALLAISLLPLDPGRAYASTFSDILDQFHDPNGRVHVVAHKADWHHHPENSLSAIQSSIDMGVEMVELDIRKTKDGIPVLMHDDNINDMTNGTGKVADLTLAQIKSYYLKEGEGGPSAPLTTERIPTLEEALNVTKNKAMVNLDKCWDIRNDVWNVLVQTGTTNQAIFKSTAANSVVDAWLDSKSPRPLYAAVLEETNVSLLDDLLAGAKPDIFELVFDQESDVVASEITINKILNGGSKIWMNTMLSHYAGGHTDSGSLVDPESGWGWVINKGASFIQTDQPQKLINYLNLRQPLASGWNQQDIGAVEALGSSGWKNEQFTISASGYDIWAAADEFHYVYQPVNGNVTIVAQVADMENTNGYAKAGIMIRETLDSGSKFADVVVTPSEGIKFQRRITTGQNLTNTTGYSDSTAGKAPQFVKLVRSGDSFTAYNSTNGSTWQQIGSAVTVTMNSTVYVGLAVTSHNDGVLGNATFKNVSLTQASPYTLTTVALQQGVNGYTQTTDAHLIEWSSYASRNTGGNDELETSSYSGASNDEKHALIRFGIPAAIPSNAIITSAQLEVKLSLVRNGAAHKLLQVHEVTGSWTEGSGTGIDGQSVTGVNWTNKPSYGTATLDQHMIHNIKDSWYTFNVTGLVQNWVNGSKTNNGIVLLENTVNTAPGSKAFASSEFSNASSRPILVITYRTP
ncbi:glycerophosphodiester phosphodiesterase family protein [Paenibacillus sp. Root444D2]|uniref:glycerophosphodiester phosphodiesterase family protein n=1 Tax=Paenibacillus sp. Root444D2 TaxID=1736538 RepID=UPI00070CFB9D|nr:glycerophosphodiester phosphodiesterase family protein [Paenibacillus sp. Root444D2]KQX45733.1 hypothetical protein ASD40_17910 [Paenibacillus sp. Root444D2]